MLKGLLITVGIFLGAYVVFRIIDSRTLFDRHAFPELFAAFSQMKLKRAFMMKIYFQDVPQWFILRRDPDNVEGAMWICFPRVGYSDADYARLESKFIAHSFDFEHEPEMSRFYAKVPIRAGDSNRPLSDVAAHAGRLFMEALDIDSTAKFRRSFDVD